MNTIFIEYQTNLFKWCIIREFPSFFYKKQKTANKEVRLRKMWFLCDSLSETKKFNFHLNSAVTAGGWSEWIWPRLSFSSRRFPHRVPRGSGSDARHPGRTDDARVRGAARPSRAADPMAQERTSARGPGPIRKVSRPYLSALYPTLYPAAVKSQPRLEKPSTSRGETLGVAW